jgi:hypothetical protein
MISFISGKYLSWKWKISNKYPKLNLQIPIRKKVSDDLRYLLQNQSYFAPFACNSINF